MRFADLQNSPQKMVEILEVDLRDTIQLLEDVIGEYKAEVNELRNQLKRNGIKPNPRKAGKNLKNIKHTSFYNGSHNYTHNSHSSASSASSTSPDQPVIKKCEAEVGDAGKEEVDIDNDGLPIKTSPKNAGNRMSVSETFSGTAKVVSSNAGTPEDGTASNPTNVGGTTKLKERSVSIIESDDSRDGNGANSCCLMNPNENRYRNPNYNRSPGGSPSNTRNVASSVEVHQMITYPEPHAESDWHIPLSHSRDSISTVDLTDIDGDESLERFRPRLKWLVSLLLFQSTSSFILKSFHELIDKHPSMVYFLTMLVGAGGNAGGQSVVLCVRELTLGRKVDNMKQFRMGFFLACALSLATVVRVCVQQVTSFWTGVALSGAMFCIVWTAVIVGTGLPQLFKKCGIDPAHASAAIQVSMDVLGITITCVFASLIFDLVQLQEEHGGSFDQSAEADFDLWGISSIWNDARNGMMLAMGWSSY